MRLVVAVDEHDGMATGVVQALAPWTRVGGTEIWLVTVLNPEAIHETAIPTGHAHSVTPQGSQGTRTPIEEPPPRLAEDRGQALEWAREAADSFLAQLASDELAGATPRLEVLFDADPAASILETARSVSADAIVLGSHGRTGLSRALMGSVAEEVTRSASVPVVIVGPRAGASEGD